jgi:hypothetical protein
MKSTGRHVVYSDQPTHELIEEVECILAAAELLAQMFLELQSLALCNPAFAQTLSVTRERLFTLHSIVVELIPSDARASVLLKHRARALIALLSTEID